MGNCVTSGVEKKRSRNPNPVSDNKYRRQVISFTLLELDTITNSFCYILGNGGFGTVYKGCIYEGLKFLHVAVKMMNKMKGFQGHQEWRTEVEFLDQHRHPNVVKLIGYCCEDDHRLLVYELMFNGSVESHLFRKSTDVPLSWSRRIKIALGAAKGLAFLHNADRPIVYRDLKTSNILLDSNFTAKLSDFGFAIALPQGETHVNTRVMGTCGYIAPEYRKSGYLTARSDVYSFGVVLLELLTGKKSLDKTRPSKEWSLVNWARPKLSDKRKMLQIIDTRLDNHYSVEAACKACTLAYHCLSQKPKARPLMSDVVKSLELLQTS